MDIRLIIFIVIIVAILLLVLSIIKRSIKLGITCFVYYILITAVVNALPIELKASLDLSLALTGSKFFEKVEEENLEYIKQRGLTVNFGHKATYVYPIYKSYQDAPEITKENNNDFNIDYFDVEKRCVGFKLNTTEHNAETVTKVLKSLGIRVKY